MARKITYLHLEDEQTITDLVMRLLKQEGYEVRQICAETEADYRSALANQQLDFIIADYALPTFDGLSALEILRKQDTDLPFILFSGSIGEEKAIQSLRNGVTDYVLKQNIKALVPAINRALESYDAKKELKRIQQEVEQSNRLYRSLFNSAPDGLVLVDNEGIIINCNEQEQKLCGYERSEIIGKRIDFSLSPKFKGAFEQNFPRLRETGYLDVELEIKTKEGQLIPIWRRASIIKDATNDFAGAIVYNRDISEQKRAEATRKAMLNIANAALSAIGEMEFYEILKSQLNTLLDTSNFFIGMYEKETDSFYFPYMQDEKDSFTRVPAANTMSSFVIRDKKSILLVGADAVNEFIDSRELKRVGTPSHCWLGVPLIAEEETIGLLVVQSYQDDNAFDEDDRRLLEFVASQIAGSISRKQAESKLYQLSRSVEQSPVSTVITDLSGSIQYVNPKFCQVTGYSYDEAIGQNPRILKSGETPASEYKNLWATITTGNVWRGRFHNKKKNGELFWEDATIGPIKNEQGETTHYLAVKEDITRLVEDELHLKRLNRQNEILLATFPSVLLVMNADEQVIRWNKKAEEVFGLTWADVQNKHLHDLKLDWSWGDIIDGIAYCRDNKEMFVLTDVPVDRADGVSGFLNVTIAPFLDEGSIIDGYLIHAEDITEKKIAEGQQAHAQKLESIGQLAAGIAHEINTPAQYVGDNTHFLQDSFNDLARLFEIYDKMLTQTDGEDQLTKLLQEAREVADEVDLEFLREEIPLSIEQSLDGITKVSKIVRAMKEFSHPGSKDKSLVDLNRAIENTITVSRNEWKYAAELHTELDETLPEVLCYPDEFNQVILNMIINASHAIQEVHKEDDELGNITIKTAQNGDRVEIRISDDGSGMPEHIKKKIFDPFFTTKEVGRGTGQGLAISHDVIVNKHQGTIEVESEPGKGTTFIVGLPL